MMDNTFIECFVFNINDIYDFVINVVFHQTAALYTASRFNLGVRLHFIVFTAQPTAVPRLLGKRLFVIS